MSKILLNAQSQILSLHNYLYTLRSHEIPACKSQEKSDVEQRGVKTFILIQKFVLMQTKLRTRAGICWKTMKCIKLLFV